MGHRRIAAVAAVAVVAALGLGGWALGAARGGAGHPPPGAATPATAPACRATKGELGGGQGALSASRALPWRIRLGPSAPLARSAAAARAARRGQALVVSGRVLAADCATPVAGATLHVWQTNGDGVYGPPGGGDEIECCYLQGTLTTGADGRFEFATVRPGNYQGARPAPAAHIHVEVRHPDGRGVLTELLFADDPAVDRGSGEVLRLTRAPGSPWRGTVDLVLGAR
jgi:hypothetical protein